MSDFEQVDEKIIRYALEYIKGYSEVVDKHYHEIHWQVKRKGLELAYFPLYGRKLGVDVGIAVFFTKKDFYIFFLEEQEVTLKIVENASENQEFDESWTFNTPDDKKLARVKQYLGLDKSTMLGKSSVPGANLMSLDVENIGKNGYNHGNNFGMQAGRRAESGLPKVLAFSDRMRQLSSFKDKYQELLDSKISTQARGREFEILWRNTLDFYGWNSKKIRISGEENDFTALHQGLHVLGEVRWYAKPMPGGKLREFLGKLDTRPQTIGLFISHSGLDKGAWSVVRRAVNTKTVVVFSRKEIDQIFLEMKDPAELFNVGLREAYDYLFEKADVADDV